ncbi:MAG: class I SAM-dependent methyltransferase [Gammaproteobacteria bacterium]
MRWFKAKKVVDDGNGIMLDIGCGGSKNEGWIGIDKRPLSGVDIIHDLEVFPYPLPDECAHIILASHILEHIKPWLSLDIMNELWRIMKPEGQLYIIVPYAGSHGYYQDPTHCNPWNESTLEYFDPDYPLYGIYLPKPWLIHEREFNPKHNLEVRMLKRALASEATVKIVESGKMNSDI